MKRKAPCFTIQRLLSLRKGQRMVYYTGRFDADIRRCETGYQLDSRSPTAAALLREIRETAETLLEANRVKLEERLCVRIVRHPSSDHHWRPTYNVYQYTAEGLR